MGFNALIGDRATRMTLVMCGLFGTTGMVLPYLARWLEVERGLGGAEIGAVLSLASLTRIFTGPATALLADGAADRRTPIRVLAFAAAAAYAAFFFLAHDFWALLITGYLALSLMQNLVPFVEAGLLRATAQGKISYGLARGIGSLAFIFANVAGGALIARFGLGAVVAWVLTSLTITFLASWLALPRDRTPVEASPRSAGARFGDAKDLLRDRRFLLLIFSCGLIQSGHAFYYGFSTLVWRAQGVSADTIGQLWAIGVAIEVAFLWSLPLLERRATPEALILIGAGAGLVRWIAMGFAPTGFVLWPLQALHGLTFAAAHVGAMRLLYRDTPERSAGLAQALYSSLSGGLLIGIATLGSGVLYDHIGAQAYWSMALISLAGGALALLLLKAPVRGFKA